MPLASYIDLSNIYNDILYDISEFLSSEECRLHGNIPLYHFSKLLLRSSVDFILYFFNLHYDSPSIILKFIF